MDPVQVGIDVSRDLRDRNSRPRPTPGGRSPNNREVEPSRKQASSRPVGKTGRLWESMGARGEIYLATWRTSRRFRGESPKV